jgi:hypothetical protein
MKIVNMVNVNVEVSSDKKFMRNGGNLRGESLKVSKKLENGTALEDERGGW